MSEYYTQIIINGETIDAVWQYVNNDFYPYSTNEEAWRKLPKAKIINQWKIKGRN